MENIDKHTITGYYNYKGVAGRLSYFLWKEVPAYVRDIRWVLLFNASADWGDGIDPDGD